MISRSEFLEKTKNLLTEEDKKQVASSAKKYMIGGIFIILLSVALGVVAVLTITDQMGSTLIFISVVLLIIGISILATRRASAYKKVQTKYKAKVIDTIMQGEKYTYNRTGVISSEVYYRAGLNCHYDKYTGEDLLSIDIPKDDGSASGVNLTISDVKTISIEEDSEGKRSERTVFNGAVGYISFPFEFKCILTLNRGNYRFAPPLEKVQLEGIEFNKKYAVRANNQIEARYILTTDLMQKLDKISQHIKEMGLVLYKNMMYITLPKNKLFNMSAKSKEISGEAFEPFYDDMSVLMGIVKEIQQNDKVFKME
ncbi:MAG: DUF3137 domain-containing protein [Clostridiales bacterium]|nr:DUF3137 domain-containing protein [Clostridiales bacterium]